MEHTDFSNEVYYFICRSALIGLHRECLISEHEFALARAMLLERFHPVLGSLY